MRKITLTKLASTLVALSCGISFAHADTTSTNLTLNTVTVVGTLDKLGKADVTQSNLKLDVKALAQQTGARKLDESLIYQAGIYANFAPSNHYNILRIRSFYPEYAVDGTTISYSNGLYNYNPVLFGIERVEINKGANSVLYGATQPGGTVNLISKRPTQERQGLLQLQVGSKDRYSIGVDYSDRINDSVRYRLVGQWENSRGEKTYTSSRQYYFAPSFTIDFSPNTSLTFLTNFNVQNGRPNTFVVPGYGSYLTTDGSFGTSTYFGEPAYSEVDTKQFSAGWELSHKFNDNLKFEQNYRYLYINSLFYDVAAGMAQIDMRGNTSAIRSYVYNKGKFQEHYFDNRLVANGEIFKNVKATVAVGVDLLRTTVNGNYATGTAPSISLYNTTYFREGASSVLNNISPTRDYETQNQVGTYLLTSFDIAKLLTVNYGLHYTSVNGKTESAIRTNSYNTGHTTHSGGLALNLPWGFTPYVNYSEAFRARAPLATSTSSTDTLAYNTTKQLQSGLKYSPENFDGYFEVGYFNIKDRNPFRRDDLTGSYTQTDLKQNTHGWELTAKANITSWWQTSLAYTYTNATTYRTTTVYETNGIPKHQVAFWNNFAIGNKLDVGFGVRYYGTTNARSIGYLDLRRLMQRQSPYVSVADGRTKPVWLFDMAISYDITPNWNLGLNATNLFNEKYLTNCNSVCYFGATRNVVATATYKW
ncbi:TonB-dependent siderophore receptor [Psittacicella hinzii]|uniref:Ferrichrome-iron receptor n=1 Tax=Psittacicella hinzii TaxID=2028575 RepID=A0A3A1YLZ4_9GAMM|nr:TonB-dependent receptor [Psittacicella hinzii]RIY38486.1 hypothetical protein CKF58_04210 [Psittacicella hinzii]